MLRIIGLKRIWTVKKGRKKEQNSQWKRKSEEY